MRSKSFHSIRIVMAYQIRLQKREELAEVDLAAESSISSPTQVFDVW